MFETKSQPSGKQFLFNLLTINNKTGKHLHYWFRKTVELLISLLKTKINSIK